MRFDYAPYPGADGDVPRPIIPITLHNPRLADAPSVGYHGLVDSGADFCVFSREIADMLELDLAAGEEQFVTKFRDHLSELEIGKRRRV